MLIKDSRMLIISICLIALIVCTSVYYLFFTTQGSGLILKLALSKYTGAKSVVIQTIEGNLAKIISLRDVKIEDLKWLPEGNIIEIQKLDIYHRPFALKGLNAVLQNGRLKLPNSDLILFHGSYQNAGLDINIYSKNINLINTLDLFIEDRTVRDLSGSINDIDVYLKGSLSKPSLTGGFQIQRLSRKGFSMANCPGVLNLNLKDINSNLKLYGEIMLMDGTISGPKTAVIRLQQSKILFSGNPKKPNLDFKGTSIVESTKINIVLKGTLDKPDLKLTSEPAMSQSRLLVMLATNKRWRGVEESLAKGEMPADLVKDFIDYFVFAGSGSKMARRFGISDLLIKYDSQSKGVEVKKTISDKLTASYGVEQSQGGEGETTANHKVGAEYKIKENISVEASRELKVESKTDQSQDSSGVDDKVTIKYKKEF